MKQELQAGRRALTCVSQSSRKGNAHYPHRRRHVFNYLKSQYENSLTYPRSKGRVTGRNCQEKLSAFHHRLWKILPQCSVRNKMYFAYTKMDLMLLRIMMLFNIVFTTNKYFYQEDIYTKKFLLKPFSQNLLMQWIKQYTN